MRSAGAQLLVAVTLHLSLHAVLPNTTIGLVRRGRRARRTAPLPYELADVLQAAELQVGNIPLVLVPVLVGGVDVCDAGSFDQRDTLVTRTFGYKQEGGLLRFDGSSPEDEGVLLRVNNVSVFASLSVLLFVVHLGVLGVM